MTSAPSIGAGTPPEVSGQGIRRIGSAPGIEAPDTVTAGRGTSTPGLGRTALAGAAK